MRHLVLTCSLCTLLASPAARAAHDPDTWNFDQVIHGEYDGYEGSPGNTVNSIVVNDMDGEMELTACCSDVDCSGANVYHFTWQVEPIATSITKGQVLEVHMTNELVSGSCLDIDPFMAVCGNNGSPASQVTEQNIAMTPGAANFAAPCNRFYTEPNERTDHVPSPHEVRVEDFAGMNHDGYFWINITQRWGMQYEIVWIYRAPEEVGAGGAGAEGGAGGAGAPSGGSAGDDTGVPSGGSAGNDTGVPSGGSAGNDTGAPSGGSAGNDTAGDSGAASGGRGGSEAPGGTGEGGSGNAGGSGDAGDGTQEGGGGCTVGRSNNAGTTALAALALALAFALKRRSTMRVR